MAEAIDVPGGEVVDDAGAHDFARTQKVDGLKSGTWFTQLLRYSLDTYSKRATADFFKQKYPGLPVDAVVDRRIALARKYSAVEGALTASAYTMAVAATIGSGGGASPLTLPGAVGAFAVDLFATTQIQLRLSHDIAVLYQFPIDMEDPEDLMDLLRVAFGIKAATVLEGAATKVAPEAVRQGVKAVIRGPVLGVLQRLPLVGRYLLQRNIMKFAIPAIGIPLSSGINYLTTGSVGARAKELFRDKATTRESARNLRPAVADECVLLLRVVWMAILADGKVQSSEVFLLNELVAQCRAAGAEEEWLAEFEGTVTLDKPALLALVGQQPEPVRAQLYTAACVAVPRLARRAKREVDESGIERSDDSLNASDHGKKKEAKERH